MMSGIFLGHSKRHILSLLILCLSSSVLLSQKNLSGNINQPSAHVVSIPASDRVVVDDVTGFSASGPDTVIVIQMQGVGITTPTTGYGYIQNILGQPGLHEFMIIQSVNTGTKEIVFRNNLLNTFDPKGNIQVVRVPYYNNVTITGKLFCNPWNSTTKKGGVLALVIGRTLKLNANIDVSNSGFAGGKDTIGVARCAMVAPTTILDYYARSFNNAGFKGEGIAIHDDFGTLLVPLHMKGQGPNFTSGGGGNGRFSGGGGGSNHGTGGIGGFEDNTCTAPQSGGLGGFKSEQPTQPSFINRIFFGGGGGASTSLTGLSPSGGNGGGIVLIVSDTIISNGGNILANGGNGGTAVLNGGSGGGGGGGSIALSIQSYGSKPLTLSAQGGKGGDNPGAYGEGGGGGGGFLYVSKNTTGNVISVLSGGLPGNDPFSTATAGGTGELRTGFKAVLNGFLFNSISSSVTGNQIDSVCSNMIPPKIFGTIPVGGTGPYTYLWEKSYNQVTWVALTNDPDPTNYTSTVAETATVYFRRTITDSSPTPLVDISKSVKINVQPFIKNNIVGNSDTICFAQDPVAFTSKATLQDGNGKYTFNWGVSLNNSVFSVPSNAHTSEGYDPPAGLTVTSWYRRTVTSGRCIDSTAIAKITVLDTIRNNKILNAPPDICYGSTFVNLSATSATTTPALGGGDNSYIYFWEGNINGAGWTTAPGVSNGPDYNPVELPQRTPFNQYIFRRTVYSGSNKVCASTSNQVILKDYPVISNNTVTPVAPVCSGSAPSTVFGSKTPALSGGNTIYTYSWQNRTKIQTFWSIISGATNADYQPPVLTDTTFYRRIVTSSACSDVSDSIMVAVHKPILNNNITVSGGGITETRCYNQQPGLILSTGVPTGGTGPGSYIYQWKSSPDNVAFTSVSGGTGINYQPPQLTATTYYNRQVTSGACIVNSNTITETVLPSITNNTISGTPKVCYSLVPDVITGGTLAGGSGVYKYFWWQSTDGGTNWIAAAGTNNTPAYQPPALITPTVYERTVTSGLNDCCSSTSNVFDIGIDPLPASQINAGPDTIIYSVEKLYHMKAIAPVLPETGTWKILNNGSGKIADTTKNNTIVRDLTAGKNSFLWTVHRGPCQLKDSVNIVLLEDFVPQGFSPNGDAFNNTFVIEGLNLDDNYVDLDIVNSAGSEVFKTTNRDNQKWTDWDGKNSKGVDLAEGTYYYLLKITPKPSQGVSGAVSRKQGFIILKRY
jgi:CHU_C Type IX secretion signal domain